MSVNVHESILITPSILVLLHRALSLRKTLKLRSHVQEPTGNEINSLKLTEMFGKKSESHILIASSKEVI